MLGRVCQVLVFDAYTNASVLVFNRQINCLYVHNLETSRTSVYSPIACTQEAAAPLYRQPHFERNARSVGRRYRERNPTQICRDELTRPSTCGVVVGKRESCTRRNILENLAGTVGNVQFWGKC